MVKTFGLRIDFQLFFFSREEREITMRDRRRGHSMPRLLQEKASFYSTKEKSMKNSEFSSKKRKRNVYSNFQKKVKAPARILDFWQKIDLESLVRSIRFWQKIKEKKCDFLKKNIQIFCDFFWDIIKYKKTSRKSKKMSRKVQKIEKKNKTKKGKNDIFF